MTQRDRRSSPQKPGTERNFVNGFLIAIALLLVGFAIYWLAF